MPVDQLDPDEAVCMHDLVGSRAASINFLKSIVRPGCIGFEYNCLHIFGAFHVHNALLRIIVDAVEPGPAARVEIPFAKSFHDRVAVKSRRVHHRKGFRLLSAIIVRIIVCESTDQPAIFCPNIPVVGRLIPRGIVGNAGDAVEDLRAGQTVKVVEFFR